MPKFENIDVQLIGMDGNAFSILGRVLDAMKKSGLISSGHRRFCQRGDE